MIRNIASDSSFLYYVSMPTKSFVMLGLTVGSILGGYAPLLFGGGEFSYVSLFTTAIGATIGVYAGFKIGESFN